MTTIKYDNFDDWSRNCLGQGYSLEKDEDGVYIDKVTRWASNAWSYAEQAVIIRHACFTPFGAYREGSMIILNKPPRYTSKEQP